MGRRSSSFFCPGSARQPALAAADGVGCEHGVGDAAPGQILHVELGAALRIETLRQYTRERQAQHEKAALLFGLGE